VAGLALLPVGEELHDQPLLRLREERLDGAHDPGPASDLEAVAYLERIRRVEVTGGDYGFCLAELVLVARHYSE
jgi:hypothetical protein